ncbi:MAG: AsmA family protein [Endomicrobia bacterium]|nr:AsmA family protein [Endomicrobiia bacterium]
MNKIIKFAFVFLCFVFLAVIAALTILKSVFSEERIRKYVDDAASTYLGREVKYEKLSFAFVGVNLKGFSISEAPSFDNGTFAKIKKFSVRLEIFPLIKREIRVKKINVNGLEIKIVKGEDNKFNFDDILGRFETPSADETEKLSLKETPAPEKKPLPDIYLDKFVIKKSNISYEDLPAKLVLSVNDINALTEGFSLSKAFICALKLNVKYKDEKFDLAVPVDAVMTANLKNMDMAQADFNMTSLKINFEDMNIEGKAFVKNLSDPSITAKAVLSSLSNKTLKQFANELPDFTVNQAEFSANITMSDFENAAFSVEKFQAEMEGMKIEGKVSAVNLNDLRITAEASLTSLSNNTLKYFAGDLPAFIVTKADFSAKAGINDLKNASADITSVQAEFEDMKLNAKASVKDFTAPEIDINASVTSFTDKTLKQFMTGLPEFSVSRADFDSKINLDLDKNAAFLKNARISVLGSDAKVSGTINWAEDLKYDLKAEINFILDTVEFIMPEIAKVYKPKGKITGAAEITRETVKADIKTDDVSFQFEPMFTAGKVNSNVKIESLDSIKLTALSGLFNDKKFNGAADYSKTKDSVNVNVKFDMDALVLNSLPETSETQPAKAAEKTPSPLSLPLNLTADLKAGAVKIPYFHSDKGALINIKMTGITDKLDKAGGTVKFNISSGNIDDADKLAKANKITKVMFFAFAIVDKAGKALKIDALKGSYDKEGIGYDNFDGELNFVNGKMNIQKMDFVSKAVTMKISGTSDFKADKLDMKASIQPGANKPVIMKITGTSADPKGSLDVAASINSIFGKEIESLMNSGKKDVKTNGDAADGSSVSSSASAAAEVEKSAKPDAVDILKSLGSIFGK